MNTSDGHRFFQVDLYKRIGIVRSRAPSFAKLTCTWIKKMSKCSIPTVAKVVIKGSHSDKK